MVSEFGFVENLRSKYALAKVGDDCAVLPKDADTDLLLTADMLIEDIDFRLEWTSPEFLGHKALAVSLSDIAAMGGKPKWAMLSIGVPKTLWSTDFIDKFYAGWFALANEFSVELVGGDISHSPDRLVIDSIAGGEVTKDKAILRSTARPGDLVYITGTLGGAAGGLKLLEQGFLYTKEIREHTFSLLLRQLKPQPHVSTANLLQTVNMVTSAIDVSDGLSSDLGHICRESNVGARIHLDKLPIHSDLADHFAFDERLALVLNGGEDYELLFTVSPEFSGNIPGVWIGEITESGLEIVEDGIARPLDAQGYEHFGQDR